jgi:hypothetical protein
MLRPRLELQSDEHFAAQQDRCQSMAGQCLAPQFAPRASLESPCATRVTQSLALVTAAPTLA